MFYYNMLLLYICDYTLHAYMRVKYKHIHPMQWRKMRAHPQLVAVTFIIGQAKTSVIRVHFVYSRKGTNDGETWQITAFFPSFVSCHRFLSC